MDTSHGPESFRGLLLRHRGRTGLIQRDLATRAGVSRGAVQDWESGLNHPTAERLKALIRVFLEAGGLTAGQEASEAHALWAAAERESARMRTPFDEDWFSRLLTARAPHTPGAAADSLDAARPAGPAPVTVQPNQDWGDAPDTLGFVGRVDELALLRRWVVDERCRLVAVLGMGGVGKTTLAARLAQDVASSFERVYWRSLRDAPPVSDWLAGAIGFLSDRQLVPPSAESELLAALLRLLRDRRCLLGLDNSETLFEPGQQEGRYREGMAGYSRLLEAVGGASHQSCLVLTSREAPPELVMLGSAVRTFELGGLGADEAQQLLASKQLEGTSQQWGELNARFGGNGLALKVVAETIRELFGGQLGSFLEEASEGSVFGGLRRLLTEQVERSSALEQQVLRLLAVDREPVRVSLIVAKLEPSVGRGAVLEAVEALRRRSLVERVETSGVAAFTLQSVVLEYVTDQLVEEVSQEIQRGRAVVMVEQPLILAQAKDYVRQTQERLIGAPVLQVLKAHHGEGGTEQRLLVLLENWRGDPSAEQGYGPGNVVNLLRLLRGDLRGLDLSRLEIRQAYLAEVDAQDASLMGAHLVDAVLAEAFNFPGSVALSADGTFLAAGTSTGQVMLWRVADRKPLLAVHGHTGGVRAVALSSDGQLVASAGGDGSVGLWEVRTGRAVAILQASSGMVWGVALSADGQLVASGGGDGSVWLWEVRTGRPVVTLQAHSGRVWGVALSADAQLLASGGEDGTVRLWETSTGQSLATLQGNAGAIYGVALSADGQLVASGGEDGTVRLWEASTGWPLGILQGHTGVVWGVALSANGELVASGGGDGTVRLWTTSTGRPLAALQGHVGIVRDLALSADGELVASGGWDGTVRLSEARTGRPLVTLQGHTGTVRSVALSADGELVASCGGDGAVRLWKASDGRQLATLEGHTSTALVVALSADGELVASGGEDGTVQLWETTFAMGDRAALSAEQTQSFEHAPPSGGRRVAILQGHTGPVRGVALSADSQLLVSGGGDGTIRLWEARSGRPLAILEDHTVGGVWGVALSGDGELVAGGGEDGTVRGWRTSTGRPLAPLEGHTGTLWGVALSADGELVASGGEDGTVRLWETSTGQLLATLHGHTGTVWGVALSAKGELVASCGEDGMVRLWEARTGQPLAILQGHTGVVWGVALSADGQLVASGGFDGTVQLWKASTGSHLRTLRVDRRYERLAIAGLTGITDAQCTALLALGAVGRPILAN
jgi:WD40 repeat protein/transcriptional regulator with XRE-family HTH domain